MKIKIAKFIFIIMLAMLPLEAFSSGVPVPGQTVNPPVKQIQQQKAPENKQNQPQKLTAPQQTAIPKSSNIQKNSTAHAAKQPAQPVKTQAAKPSVKATQIPEQPTKPAKKQTTKPSENQAIKPPAETAKQPANKPANPKPAAQTVSATAQTIQQTEQKTAKTYDLNDIREQAKFLYNSNKLDEAQQLFNKISESEKDSEDFLFLANIAQDKSKPIDAVFFLKKAIELDDNNYKAHYNLGNLYFADDKINMAIDEYKKVLRIKKDFAYAYYNKGCCYLKKKSWFNAKYEFGLAIKANPEEPSFYYNLAYTYKMMKRPKKAQEALDIYNELMSR